MEWILRFRLAWRRRGFLALIAAFRRERERRDQFARRTACFRVRGLAIVREGFYFAVVDMRRKFVRRIESHATLSGAKSALAQRIIMEVHGWEKSSRF